MRTQVCKSPLKRLKVAEVTSLNFVNQKPDSSRSQLQFWQIELLLWVEREEGLNPVIAACGYIYFIVCCSLRLKVPSACDTAGLYQCEINSVVFVKVLKAESWPPSVWVRVIFVFKPHTLWSEPVFDPHDSFGLAGGALRFSGTPTQLRTKHTIFFFNLQGLSLMKWIVVNFYFGAKLFFGSILRTTPISE